MRHSFMLDIFLTIDLIDLHIQFCVSFTPAASPSDVCDSTQVTSSICSMPVPLQFIWGKKPDSWFSLRILLYPARYCSADPKCWNPDSWLQYAAKQTSLLYGNVFLCYQLVWVVQGAGEGAQVS